MGHPAVLRVEQRHQRRGVGAQQAGDGAQMRASVEVPAARGEVVVLHGGDDGAADVRRGADLLEGHARLQAGRREGLADGHDTPSGTARPRGSGEE